MTDEEPDCDERGDRSFADLHALEALQSAADDFNRTEHMRMAAHRQAIFDLLLR
jgi:hypothetical protein